MATFEEEPVNGASDDAETLESLPYILTPSYGERVRNPVKVTGGGHAKRNVKIIGAYNDTDLGDERQMGNDGIFELTFRDILTPGINQFRILQWVMYPDSYRYSEVWTLYNVAPPVLDPKHNNQVVGDVFSLKGSRCPVRERVICKHFQTGDVIGEGRADGLGNFEFPVSMVGRPRNMSLSVVWFQNVTSDGSDLFTVRRLTPHIESPTNSTIVGKTPIVRGNGLDGSIVTLYSTEPGGTKEYGYAFVSNGQWSITPNADLPEGAVRLLVKAQVDSTVIESDPVWVNVIQTPLILSPDPGAVVDTTFTIEGSKGMRGATVEILRDTVEHSVVATGSTIAGTEAWRVTVPDMTPGPLSLRAEQFVAGLADHSDRSGPRAFKVRPAPVSNISITTPLDGSIKVAGSGYSGATVEITRDSGPDAPAIPSVPVVDGKWEVTVPNWPFGSYTLSIIQKVGDGASGWIPSVPVKPLFSKVLPEVSNVKSTSGYKPTISGAGTDGATVKLLNDDESITDLPDVVVRNNQWSSTAPTEWGPTFERVLLIKQSLGLELTTGINHTVTIPPLAPGLNEPVEDGLSPKLSGTCWPGAVVKVKFSDSPEEHPATVLNGNWAFQRPKEFAPDILHTVEVFQVVGKQTSEKASKTFTVSVVMLKPTITKPDANSKVGRVVTVEGGKGMAGATLQLRDVRFDRDLGAPKVLSKDGVWSIDLTHLEFRTYTIDARQTLKGRPSDPSDRHSFEVVLLPPEITQPTPDGKLPRTATLMGKGMVNGRVEVFLEGRPGPWLTDIAVDGSGEWEVDVTLPVGSKTIWARQTFMDEGGKLRESDITALLNYDVVPAAPFIETPVADGHIGRLTVVSGFGVPGDSVTVTLAAGGRSIQANARVLEDRTWSVTRDFSSLVGGRRTLEAVASLGEFASLAATRPVVLGTYLPTLDEPAAGRWVSHPLQFAGRGRKGSGQVVSWYNPDVRWVPEVPIANDKWSGESTQSLPGAGNWYRFQQNITDGADAATASDWVDSQRFEVEPAQSPSVDN